MITDTALSFVSNALGSGAMVLIIAYHIIAVSTKRHVDSMSSAAVQANKPAAVVRS